MNSVTKPIVASFHSLAANTFYTYAIELYNFAAAASVEIYRGKCYTDGSGNMDVRIDEVCRDYTYRFPRRWQQDRQSYVPAALTDFFSALSPSDYIFTAANVVIYDSNGQFVVNNSGNVFWFGWLPEWQHGDLVYFDDQVANLALLGNGEVPHLPPVATTKMWLELVLQWFDTHGTQPILTDGGNTITLLTSGQGCYDMAFTLRDLFDALNNQDIDGGDSDSTPDDEIDGGDSDDVPSGDIDGGDSTDEYTVTAGVNLSLIYGVVSLPVAHIDTCASPYYVAWILPSGGWMCWGFDGNATVAANPQTTAIRDTMDTDRVTNMDVQAIFSLFTGLLTREQYNLLTTLAFAREVYLYDVNNDHGVWCSVEGRTLPTAGNVRWRNEPFNVTLKEIIHAGL